MAKRFQAPRAVPSLDVFLDDIKVGTIVRTPGDFNAFSFDDDYRATGGYPVLSLSFRAATGASQREVKSAWYRSAPSW